MDLLKSLVLILVLPVAALASDFGLNGRNSSGYCTDPSGTTYVLDGSLYTYPTTQGGGTFGFTATDSDNSRDRDNALDCRLAGVIFQRNDGNKTVLKIDVPSAGSYDVRLAVGEATFDRPDQKVEVLDSDGTTNLFTITSSTLTANKWIDANGNVRTSASDWVTNNTARTVTLSGTSIVIKLGTDSNLGGGESRSTLSHVRITSASTPSNLPLLQAIGEE